MDEFVGRHPFRSIFHTARWAGVLQRTFSCSPVYLVLEKAGAISGAIPFMAVDSRLTGRRLISLPRTSYCDPLVERGDDLEVLLDAAIEVLGERGLSFLEIKPQWNDIAAASTKLKGYRHFHNQVLPLESGVEALWKGLGRTSVRQRIGRARNHGVTIRFGQNSEDLHAFYRLHLESTRKNAVPHRPFSFFKNIWDTFGLTGEMVLVLAEIGREVGSAGIFLKSKDTLVFEFVGNSYNLLDHAPVPFMIWEMIQYACREGFTYFDFGLTPPGNAGLLDFKSHWGTIDRVLTYYYYPDVAGYKRFVAASDETAGARKRPFARLVALTKASLASRLYRDFG